MYILSKRLHLQLFTYYTDNLFFAVHKCQEQRQNQLILQHCAYYGNNLEKALNLLN